VRTLTRPTDIFTAVTVLPVLSLVPVHAFFQ
jgi:hypothetical protein